MITPSDLTDGMFVRCIDASGLADDGIKEGQDYKVMLAYSAPSGSIYVELPNGNLRYYACRRFNTTPEKEYKMGMVDAGVQRLHDFWQVQSFMDGNDLDCLFVYSSRDTDEDFTPGVVVMRQTTARRLPPFKPGHLPNTPTHRWGHDATSCDFLNGFLDFDVFGGWHEDKKSFMEDDLPALEKIMKLIHTDVHPGQVVRLKSLEEASKGVSCVSIVPPMEKNFGGAVYIPVESVGYNHFASGGWFYAYDWIDHVVGGLVGEKSVPEKAFKVDDVVVLRPLEELDKNEEPFIVPSMEELFDGKTPRQIKTMEHDTIGRCRLRDTDFWFRESWLMHTTPTQEGKKKKTFAVYDFKDYPEVTTTASFVKTFFGWCD